MKKLINGIIDFRKNSLEEYRKKFAKLALRQAPDALFIACCDSRVVPNVFASSDPGDLFLLRNIGNLVPPYQLISHGAEGSECCIPAAIEFSLASLNVKDIIVCGHSECGAMSAIMENKADIERLPFLRGWLKYGISSYERFQNLPTQKNDLTPCNLLSRINVLEQLNNLRTYPLVMDYLQNNKLKIHGWWFDLSTADVYRYNQLIDDFVLIGDEEEKSG